MAIDQSQAVIRTSLAIEFSWNAGGSITRFTNHQTDLVIDSNTYTSAPIFEYEEEKRHGGTDHSPASIVLQADLEPLASMVTDEHAEVTFTVYEVDRDDLANPTQVFAGRVGEVEAYFEGNSDVIKATLLGQKQRFADIPLGVVTSAECANTFGDGTCQKNVASGSSGGNLLTVTALVSAIVADKITFSALAGSATQHFFQNGYVSFEGLSIRIRIHDTAAEVWVDKPPPASWVGETITVVAGCRRNLSDCTFHANTARFNALGMNQPGYEPRFEDGSCEPV